ncbi:hypothetical protein CSPAE12_08437 [Colletotrichum incanum]|nr:hypothetical protein CSPAE12_08437 [Colletotrichum incanum]
MAGAFGCMRRGPDILDHIAFSLRDNPYAAVGESCSMEDAAEQVRRIRSVRVCIGDVRSTEKMGYAALGTVGDVVPLIQQKQGRRYV